MANGKAVLDPVEDKNYSTVRVCKDSVRTSQKTLLPLVRPPYGFCVVKQSVLIVGHLEHTNTLCGGKIVEFIVLVY
jgi:hypothetical protein